MEVSLSHANFSVALVFKKSSPFLLLVDSGLVCELYQSIKHNRNALCDFRC